MTEYPRRKFDEMAEARQHLTYFQNQRPALEFAIKKMQEDLRLVEKNIKLWGGRIEKMEGKKE